MIPLVRVQYSASVLRTFVICSPTYNVTFAKVFAPNKIMFGINVFRTLTRASEESPATFTIENNPYRAQKEWPPDFTKLSPKYQLRFERRYRRRTKLKGTKPSWNRNLGLFAAGTSLSS